MKRLTFLPSLLLLSCGGQAETQFEPETAQIIAALEQLEEQDAEAVAACRDAISRCSDNVPEGGADDACAALGDRCDALEKQLTKVREPAMACWRGAQECVEHAADAARCHQNIERCSRLDDELDQNRGPVVECSARVEACLSAAGEAGIEGCAVAADACDGVAELATRAQHARASGAGNAGTLTEEARSVLDAMPTTPLGQGVPAEGAEAG